MSGLSFFASFSELVPPEEFCSDLFASAGGCPDVNNNNNNNTDVANDDFANHHNNALGPVPARPVAAFLCESGGGAPSVLVSPPKSTIDLADNNSHNNSNNNNNNGKQGSGDGGHGGVILSGSNVADVGDVDAQSQPIVSTDDRDSLQLVSQGALARQEFHGNKSHALLHMVVKNSPFELDLALDGAGNGSFSDYVLECELFYAAGDQTRRVASIKGEPVTFDVPANKRDARSLVVRARIHVLSSKHEKENFVIKVRATPTAGGAPLVVVTEPIKSVSKPDQALRLAVSSRGRSSSSSSSSSARGAAARARRSFAAVAADAVDVGDSIAAAFQGDGAVYGNGNNENDDDASYRSESESCAAASSVRSKRRAQHKSAPNKRRTAPQGMAFLSGTGAAAALAKLLENQVLIMADLAAIKSKLAC
eukprot:TRINITY_DN1731_c0_g1_i1.p1 TRINITY_DN1731_c0_g1~~TRINITY_DN1731_c0_g1_i1.p1  ORF type:complete len:422 (-),score=220.04 TRINITY_DN1731_c0_g1_i1:113-1378(-)